MMPAEIFATALGNLAARKMRTALTMLGMVFGVGAVIAMLSIGAGGEQKALESIGRLGLQNVIVKAKEMKPEDRQELRKKSLGVSLRDGEAIAEAVPNVERVLPRVEVKAYKILATGGKAKGMVLVLSEGHALADQLLRCQFFRGPHDTHLLARQRQDLTVARPEVAAGALVHQHP